MPLFPDSEMLMIAAATLMTSPLFCPSSFSPVTGGHYFLPRVPPDHSAVITSTSSRVAQTQPQFLALPLTCYVASDT